LWRPPGRKHGVNGLKPDVSEHGLWMAMDVYGKYLNYRDIHMWKSSALRSLNTKGKSSRFRGSLFSFLFQPTRLEEMISLWKGWKPPCRWKGPARHQIETSNPFKKCQVFDFQILRCASSKKHWCPDNMWNWIKLCAVRNLGFHSGATSPDYWQTSNINRLNLCDSYTFCSCKTVREKW
jgi:hypothetical protein